MTTRSAHGQPTVTEEYAASGDSTLGAAVVGSLLGGVAGGAVLAAAARIHLTFIAVRLGLEGFRVEFAGWLGLCLLMGLVFSGVAEPATGAVSGAVSRTADRLGPLGAVFRPAASPVGATTLVGLGYGLAAGLGLGMVAIPRLVGAVVPVSNTNVLYGYLAFGLVLGVGYALTREGIVPAPSASFVSPTVRAAVLAPGLAAAVSGAVVYAQQPVYLRFLSTFASYGQPLPGLGMWVGLTFLLGVVFAALARGHAAEGNSTTGYGLVYGVVLAVFVGLLAIPAGVTAFTEWRLGFAGVAGGTLAAFVVYGLVLGSTFSKTVDRRPLRPAFLVGRTRGTAAAALFGGAVAAPLLYFAAPGFLLLLAEVVGVGGSFGAGVVAWLAVAVLLGAGFASLPARRIERRDLPGQTGFKLGAAYGLLSAVTAGMFAVPYLINTATRFRTYVPYTNGAALAAFVLLGVAHGVGYGAIRGEGRLAPRFLQGRIAPAVGGVLAGAAAGGALVWATTEEVVYFRTLGAVVGPSSFAAGLGVWLAVCLLAGLLFVPLGARFVEHRVGLTRGLGVGLVYGVGLAGLLGALVVPAVMRAAGAGLTLPHTNPPVAGYLVFGVVFGGVYGRLRRRTVDPTREPTPTVVGTAGQRAVVFGSLFGGVVGGLVVHHMVGPVAMRYFGALVGRPSSAAGWAGWLGLSVLLGLAFAVALGPRLEGYADSMDAVVEDDADLEAAFGDLLEKGPLTAAATVAGFGYGVVVAVAVGAIAFPLAVNTATEFGLVVPVLQPYFLLAFVVYGLVMGMGYGVVREF